jgi:hypothetical protein
VKSGSDCPCGRGWFLVYKSMPANTAGLRVRYLRCWSCGMTAREYVKARPRRSLPESGKQAYRHTRNVG